MVDVGVNIRHCIGTARASLLMPWIIESWFFCIVFCCWSSVLSLYWGCLPQGSKHSYSLAKLWSCLSAVPDKHSKFSNVSWIGSVMPWPLVRCCLYPSNQHTVILWRCGWVGGRWACCLHLMKALCDWYVAPWERNASNCLVLCSHWHNYLCACSGSVTVSCLCFEALLLSQLVFEIRTCSSCCPWYGCQEWTGS